MIQCYPSEEIIELSDVVGLTDSFFTGIKPRPKLHADGWAERNLILSERTSLVAGPIRLALTPYLRKPIRMFSDPRVRRISICSGRQWGKTTFLFCAVGYTIDYDPGPALFVSATEAGVTASSKDRLQPLILDCPNLRRHLTGKREDFGLKAYTFDNMTMRFGWAGSETSLRSMPIRYLFKDEKSAFPMGASSAADATTTTYWNHKIAEVSTPIEMNDPMWRSMGLKPIRADMKAEQLWQTSAWKPTGMTSVYFYELKCPHCKKFIRLEWENVKWPTNVAIGELDNLGWYECQKCKKRITDGDKLNMIQPQNGARWKSTNAGHTWIAFHGSSLYSPWPSCNFGAMAARYLRARIVQDPAVMQSFVNNWLAMPYDHLQQGVELVSEKVIEKARQTYRRNEVPAGVKALIIGADIGEHKTHYVIMGVGADSELWIISWGIVEDPESLFTLAENDTWPHPAGMPMKVCIGGVDARYRRQEIKERCRRFQTLKAVQGEGQIKDPAKMYQLPWKATALDRDNKGKALVGSMTGYRINTLYWKEFIYGRLNHKDDQPCLLHLPKDRDEELERHLQSEHEVVKRKKGSSEVVRKWEPRPGFKANHYLDCLVYGCAMGHAFHLFNMAEDGKIFTGTEADQAVKPTGKVRENKFLRK